MRRWIIGMGLVWVAALGAGTAQACLLCGPSMDCASSPAGGRWCVAGNSVCVVGGACAVVVVAVLWTESRSLAAALVHGRALQLEEANPLAALDEARQAAELTPWNPRFQSTFGDIARRTGKTDEAIAAYWHAIHDDPYRASCWWRLAETKIAAHGVDAEVLQLLSKAANLNPTNTRYSQALAAAKETVRQSPGALLESHPAKETGSSN